MNRFTLLPLAFAVAASLNAAAGSSSEVKTYPATGGTAAAMSPSSSSRENMPSNATGSNTTAGSMNGSNLTDLPAKTPSDPLQADDAKAKSKTKVKTAKKKSAEPVTNKPEPYVLDGQPAGTSPSQPGATSRGDASGATSMTTPQPGRGGPTPPGVTDPPAPPPATSPSPAPSGGGNGSSK